MPTLKIRDRSQVVDKYDIPILPPANGNGNSNVQPPAPKAAKTITGQELLDNLVEAVLDERVGIVEANEDGKLKVYLTIIECSDNDVTLQTIGSLFPGGRTVVRGSSVTR